jgi:hypothetical protein
LQQLQSEQEGEGAFGKVGGQIGVRRAVRSDSRCPTFCADVFSVPAVTRVQQEDIVIMKTMLAILVLGSLALATSGANAYQSKANGYQSYPNYDRQEYQNRSCCWKTNRKAPHKVVKG